MRGSGSAVNPDRRMRLWRLVVGHAHGEPATFAQVAAAAISATGVDGAAATVTLTATPRETIYASDHVASRLAELTLILGEGPAVDAVGGPVLVADLMVGRCLTQWPGFAPAAVQAGIRAVFALPLRVGAIRLGVLILYRAAPGGLDREQLADGLLLADTACALLLDAAHSDGAHPDSPPPDGVWPGQANSQHPEIHQATGMITVQLGVTVAVALVRLGAYAYAHDRRLHEVAQDVVARRLRFHPDPDPDPDLDLDLDPDPDPDPDLDPDRGGGGAGDAGEGSR
jgi:hypothetical protein